MKSMWILLLLTIGLHAVEQAQLVGKWQGAILTSNFGTSITEKEYFDLNANRTFSLTILVNLKKGDAFVRDLRIEGSGIWRVKNDTLVLVVNKVEVPFAKEIYLISQESLRNLANTFKHRFESEPIRFNSVKYIDATKLILINEASVQTEYVRQ
ncbi:MAG TPA: hypothetical protein PLH07_02865 [Sulfurovum sp.]|nr:MAG: hypothetical protein B7Y63_05735 [Sulfurovum sp. 35-42-20]OYZ24879.1 MAG: hypothetical protein B7Y23_08140 [Sulfurovum sp. 16-42-52]OYZ50337.1 MAG: hypothetical protein B7Y13_01195 [Sulfurovum sp. 24-42-9]OZA43498.1 MAG: hypothetical protein B7X80_09225 [Sulfurovum sp. 17-42-90]OZA60660.1 MAG: hypothetical protein B7X69_02975 [Sulfurovum sp. 39-42-12]HQR73789.1 hypothetical protein [Sulfurovum sp.]